MNSLKNYYLESKSELAKDLNIKNQHRIPAVEKVVINVGAGRSKDDQRLLTEVEKTLALVTGQKPIITRAKRSVASFKIRAGQAVGAKVTLRGQRMYDFLERLVTVVLPRIRDFRGLSLSGFDKSGNYHFGIREQSIFPEVSSESNLLLHGLEVTVVTSAKNSKECQKLLTLLGFPLKREK